MLPVMGLDTGVDCPIQLRPLGPPGIGPLPDGPLQNKQNFQLALLRPLLVADQERLAELGLDLKQRIAALGFSLAHSPALLTRLADRDGQEFAVPGARALAGAAMTPPELLVRAGHVRRPNQPAVGRAVGVPRIDRIGHLPPEAPAALRPGAFLRRIADCLGDLARQRLSADDGK